MQLKVILNTKKLQRGIFNKDGFLNHSYIYFLWEHWLHNEYILKGE